MGVNNVGHKGFQVQLLKLLYRKNRAVYFVEICVIMIYDSVELYFIYEGFSFVVTSIEHSVYLMHCATF